MTFLEICQRLRQETAYGSSGPTEVTGQTGAHARAIDWVIDAYIELQNRHDWRWLRKDFSLPTVASTASYAYGAASDADGLITRFRSWQLKDQSNPARIYLTSAGQGTETFLTYMPWEHFRSVYQLGTREEGFPAFITIDPSDNIVLGPTPDDVYTVSGEFIRSAQVLAADGDTPEMPSDYHMLIVYSAMEDMGMFEVAEEIINRATFKRRRLMRQLESKQLPRMRMAGPMI